MEYCKDRTENGKLGGLFGGMSLGQEYWIVLGSSDIVVDDEVNISKIKLVIWVI